MASDSRTRSPALRTPATISHETELGTAEKLGRFLSGGRGAPRPEPVVDTHGHNDENLWKRWLDISETEKSAKVSVYPPIAPYLALRQAVPARWFGWIG